MKIQGAIFDMDGTLLDSMFAWDEAPAACLREIYGKEPRPDLMDQIRALTIAQGGEWIRQAYGLPATGTEVADAINLIMERFYRQRVEIKPGADTWLDRFRAAGIPMAVATSTDRALVEIALARTGLGSYFNAVFTCTEIGKGKSEPDIYNAALARLGTPRDHTIVFEDSYFALRTAKAAGFLTAGVYDTGQASLQPEIQALADVYIPAFDAVAPLL